MPNAWDENLEYEGIRITDGKHNSNPQAESIDLASVWRMDSIADADAALARTGSGFVYRRDGHPNEITLSRKLAKLHGGERAMVTAQGMSAIAVVALTVLKPNTHVWVADELYGKSVQLFSQDLKRWGVNYHTFDPTDKKQLEVLGDQPADLIIVETLSNPRLKMPDFDLLAEVAKSASAKLMVDNTFATHLLCRPIEVGADVVVESLGKQVNGHSDTMLGLIVAKEMELAEELQRTISTFGMASSPLDCYLTHRGLHTLGVRVERACKNAQALAERLRTLNAILSVDYPGLETHDQHQLAERQLTGGFGWMVTFRMDLDSEGVQKVFERLRPEFPFVPSLGDVNTTVSHPVSTSHRGFTEDARQALGITEGTIRVSCGIEPTQWLVDQFAASLS